MLYTYDSKYFKFIFGGSPAVGTNDGDFVSIEMDEDDWATSRGADGNVVRSNNQNVIATVTLTLQQTSPYNDYLSGIRKLDKVSGQGVKTLLVKDLLGTTKFFSKWAYIQKIANINRGIEAQGSEWTFKAISPAMYVGGNAPAT